VNESLLREDQNIQLINKPPSVHALGTTQNDNGKDAIVQVLESKLEELNRLLQERDTEIAKLKKSIGGGY